VDQAGTRRRQRLDIGTTSEPLRGRQGGAATGCGPHEAGRPGHGPPTVWVDQWPGVLDAARSKPRRCLSGQA
jgi:hypothetical protein